MLGCKKVKLKFNMELHRLSFLAITSLVSISAQVYYDTNGTSNDIYFYEKGFPNEVPYKHNNKYDHKSNVKDYNTENYKQFSPVQYIKKNTGLLVLRNRRGGHKQLRLQQRETKKLKKKLVQLLQCDTFMENNGDSSYSRVIYTPIK